MSTISALTSRFGMVILVISAGATAETQTAPAVPEAPTAPAGATPATPLWTTLLPNGRIGDATEALLELQRSGARASTTRRPVIAEVANRNYTRYLDSFKYPLPESFEATVRSGSTSGSSGASGPLR